MPPGHPPIGPDLDDPGPLAERWRRPHFLLDGRTGRRIDEAGLDARLKAARVVYVGEKHDRADHHAVQLAVIERTARLGSAGVGLEMVQRPFQAALDAFLESKDEDGLVEATEWSTRWGYDFRLYRPIFRFAADRSLPLYALNAQKELTRAVARVGPEALPAELASELPELDLEQTAHRARIHMVWAAHAAPHGGMRFDHFYAAQVTWDEAMAESVARHLAAPGGPERVVVLAGTGHVRYGEGIPSRATRRGAAPSLTILPLEPPEAIDLIGSGVADVLWILGDPGPADASVASR